MNFTPLEFAGAVAVPLFLIHTIIVRNEKWPWLLLLSLVWTLKLLLALTFGHYDIFRFIVFLQNAVLNSSANPWHYAALHPEADFPYPPLLYFIHKVPFILGKDLLSDGGALFPSAFGYTLIRIPYLIVDLVLLRWLLRMKTKKKISDWRFVSLYLVNAVFIVHQYYSGQLDLIAALPFMIGVYISMRKGLSWQVVALFSISVALKPFAILFFPFLWLSYSRGWKELPKIGIKLFVPLLIWKFSEFPFLFDPIYRAQVGKGAADILINTTFLIPFCALYACLFYQWRKDFLPSSIDLCLLVMFVVACFTFPSAGWMTWLVLFRLLSNKRISASEARGWIIWQACFVTFLMPLPEGPFFDSLATFLHRFLELPYDYPRGFLFQGMVMEYGQRVSERISKFGQLLLCFWSMILTIRFLKSHERSV